MSVISITSCKCGSGKNYDNCCAPIIADVSKVIDVEQLMRARYTAYTQNNLDFIKKTMQGNALKYFQQQQKDATEIKWVKLEVHASKTLKKRGEVEFTVTFYRDGLKLTRKDHSLFKKIEGRWYYVDEYVK